jgi:peptidoglycan/xylan/chitin deacetylase (PgdA/CDA1 family)
VAPVGLLTPPIWICDKLCRFPTMQRAGHHLLGVGRGIVEFRSAVREAGSWKALHREFGMRLPVLLYHHVGPLRPGTVPGLTVSPERFEHHVRWLARRGYTGICPSDWVRWRREGKGLPERPVLLTFDDGYADLVEYALPVLRRYGFGGAVYVVTGQMGGTNAWDKACGSGTQRLMSAAQIRYWASQGIEFGAHSRTHADLTTLSAKELAEEVIGSRDELADLLGSRVASFAYPYGSYNQAACDCVRGAFDVAFIADDQNEGLNHLLTDPHLLLRTMVQANDSLLDLECRARWGYNPILNLRARVRLRSRLKGAVRSVFGRSKP